MARGMLVGSAVLLVVATSAPVQAQEKHTIKIKEFGKGDSFVFKVSDAAKDATKVEDASGVNLKEMTTSKGRSFVYKETIVEQKAESPATVMKREYEKAVLITDGVANILPFEGKVVLIEKKGDAYKFRIEGGGELVGEDAEVLDKEFNKARGSVDPRDVMPAKPVQVDEVWNIDADKFLEGFVGKETSKLFDATKAKLTGKLVRVYKKEKAQFGVVDFEFHLPLKVGFQEMGVTLEGGEAVMKITYDGCIDGSLFAQSSQASAKYEMQATSSANGMELKVSVVSTMTMQQSWHDVSGKK